MAVSTSKITVHEKLLLAADGLESEGNSPFTAEDLVVAAWRLDPETFGLAGHLDPETGRPAYPNSNRVFAEIMGSKPIRQQGLLAKAGTKTFRLTESGKQRVQQLRSRSSTNAATSSDAKVAFGRDVARKLQKLIGTRAVEKLRSGRRDDITFTDASSFWGITARSSAMAFQARRGEVEGVLRAAEEAAAQRAIRFEHGGKAYSSEEIKQIVDLHNWMLSRFDQYLDVIRSRRDER